MEEPIADPRNPTAMIPHERRQEIASILARGVLRLRQAGQTCSGSHTSGTSENSAKQRQNGLDEGAETSPHVLARPACRQAGSHEQDMKGARKT